MRQGSSAHGYGVSAPNSNEEFKQMIIENNKEVFLENLARYIRDHLWDNQHDRYPKSFQTSKAKNKSLKKAEEILENVNKNENLRILRDAEEKGYLEDFRLSLPWHVKPFIAGEFVSFPYQHDYAILYTGINERMFVSEHFDKKGLSDKVPPQKKGFMMGREVHEPEGRINMGEITGNDNATWLGFLNVARAHANKINIQAKEKDKVKGSGVVLEIKVPTEKLSVITSPKEYRKNDTGALKQTIHISNLKELKEEFEEDFENPLQAFRYYCELSAKTDVKSTADDKIRKAEIVHFAVQSEIKTENILGVWDPLLSKKPLFEELGYFLQRNYGVEPKSDSTVNVTRTIKKELCELEKIGSFIESLEYWMESIDFDESPEKEIISNLQKFNSKLLELKEYLDQEFETEMSLSKNKSFNRKEIRSLVNYLEELENEINGFIYMEKKRAVKNQWTKDQVKKEMNYEEKINRELAEKISQIPIFELESMRKNRPNTGKELS